MSLDYEIENSLKNLSPVVDEHAEWFGRATKRIFFAGAFKGKEKLAVPMGFQKWTKEAEDKDFIETQTLNDLKNIFEELHIVATGLGDKAAYTEEPITLKEYDDFTSLYENFIFKLRRLERDCVMADSGLDFTSGLRSQHVMKTEIKRELERRARRGHPFTLVLARIDNYEEYQDLIEKSQHDEVIAMLGRLIKKCVRSFDDAYRFKEHEFIMCLKHSEKAGGLAAVSRLKHFLSKEDLMIKGEEKDIPLTMSYCVAEPLPEDTLEDLLEHMRADLDKWDEEENTALEYSEQSPLERYIDDVD